MIRYPILFPCFALLISAVTKSNMVKSVQRKQEDSLVARGATLQKISSQFSFTEGASVDKKGNIFFTDQPNDKIWKYDVDGSCLCFLTRRDVPTVLSSIIK